MQNADIKPEYSFDEKGKEVTFVLVIEGLKVERKITKAFKMEPKNANIINKIWTEQSINFGLELLSNRKVYRFHIKRLPSRIDPEKTKVKFEKDRVIIVISKEDTESWKPYIDSDFETIHLVKNPSSPAM